MTRICNINFLKFDTQPGLIPGSWILMRHVSCILLLEWSTTSQRLWVYRSSVPYAQKDPRFLFEKRRGQPREFRSLVSTTDGSTLLRTVWKICYAEHKVTGKTYNLKKKKKKKHGVSPFRAPSTFACCHPHYLLSNRTNI